MVLTNQLVYLVNVSSMRKIFSNYVCFSKSPNFNKVASKPPKFLNFSPYLAFATGSGTINVHIFGISGTFLVLFPFIAKGLVVGTFIITFLASHRTIFQHPPGIFLTFIICCPRGAVSRNKQKKIHR